MADILGASIKTIRLARWGSCSRLEREAEAVAATVPCNVRRHMHGQELGLQSSPTDHLTDRRGRQASLNLGIDGASSIMSVMRTP